MEDLLEVRGKHTTNYVQFPNGMASWTSGTTNRDNKNPPFRPIKTAPLITFFRKSLFLSPATFASLLYSVLFPADILRLQFFKRLRHPVLMQLRSQQRLPKEGSKSSYLRDLGTSRWNNINDASIIRNLQELSTRRMLSRNFS